jgi:putative CocE/NonD family hydrolase
MPIPKTTPRLHFFAVTLMSMIAGIACSNEEVAPISSDVAANAEAPRPPQGSSLEPDYTSAELDELAHSPAVERLNNPFGSEAPPDRALHVRMADGTRLAVSLYFPVGFAPEQERAPIIYIESWYGRAVETSHTPIALYRAAGFIVAAADPRGFGASFGTQSSFLSDAQRGDQRELVGWLAAQPWASGDVAVIGRSASAMMAESIAASAAPALKAAIIRATEFDQYRQNLFPGGVPNRNILSLVDFVYTWMRGEACAQSLPACEQTNLAGVDGDTDRSLLQAALRDHQTNVRGDLSGVTFVDDALGEGTFDDVSPQANVARLAAAGVPARVSASWLDGVTAEAALERFGALPELPMEVVIGATTHSGGLDADPFSRSAFESARPSALTQYAGDVDFIQRVLLGRPVSRSVSYYVLGADRWKRSTQWPPAGVNDVTLHLSQAGLASSDVASGARGERTYRVDPTTASGAERNRWASQGDAPVYYGDRRFAPGERVAFDAAPVDADMELVGAPELCIQMRSDQTDGVVLAYLEDVAPDGRVTYLTEGVLRLLHRKTASGGCDPRPGTQRSFVRADGAQVVPGEAMQIEVPLFAVAARIERGHHLRLALAGADDGTFPMLTDTPATWSIVHGATSGSTLRVPMRPWSSD